MARVLEQVLDIVDSAVDFYRDSPLCRAISFGTAVLAGLLLVDAIVGFPTGTRMAYVIPIWIATKRGGRQAGLTLVIATTLALAIVDATHHADRGTLFNTGLQTGVLYFLMRIFDSVESRLRSIATMATRDALTGLYNRTVIEERARKAIDRAAVLAQPLTVAMIDCDRFKELNDTFGHAYGDEVLRLLSRTMRRSFTGESFVGRAGGDEFVVVMPNRNRLQAISALEAALDRFMSNTEIVGRSSGFSYGIAVVGEDGFEYDQLIRAADIDMYRRKAGRSEMAGAMAS